MTATEKIDGRTARARRTRVAIVDATLALLDGGNLGRMRLEHLGGPARAPQGLSVDEARAAMGRTIAALLQRS
jgi:hypothetical protein